MTRAITVREPRAPESLFSERPAPRHLPQAPLACIPTLERRTGPPLPLSTRRLRPHALSPESKRGRYAPFFETAVWCGGLCTRNCAVFVSLITPSRPVLGPRLARSRFTWLERAEDRGPRTEDRVGGRLPSRRNTRPATCARLDAQRTCQSRGLGAALHENDRRSSWR